ncbi:hypothetical protein ACN26Y_19825 [Micromonospora sp. WMMD558]|uniref:hypothetical protein n=1 Tax=unclassified Micromonospora TaxID=2617518 RepID=UPI0012B4FA46|nr:hypothetical protein [Micromonospora sp. WMMC415]QGN48319.1 hypothetical protein GKC29_16715 [Micromonospora sp. WMMC415]
MPSGDDAQDGVHHEERDEGAAEPGQRPTEGDDERDAEPQRPDREAVQRAPD